TRDDPAKILTAYEALEHAEPNEPRWPHKRGDLLRRLGRSEEAVAAYELAVMYYAARGFLARSAAVAKIVLTIDPTRTDILERVDAEEARMHRQRHRTNLQASPLTATRAGNDDDGPSHQPPAALDLSSNEILDWDVDAHRAD